jgi:DNA topoisomerase VI subunit B
MKRDITKERIQLFIHLTKAASYNKILKEEFRRLGKKILKELIEIMGLQKGEYDIRWNPGGIACSGDHILHTDWFYLALDDGWFYYRTCKNRKDYTGGVNRIVHWDFLVNYGLQELSNAIKRDCPQHEKNDLLV